MMQGCLRIKEKDWDAGALQILMDVIHGRTREVPKVISLETLAKIAILVDYYECLEVVVEMFSSKWMESLKSTIPEIFSRDVMLCPGGYAFLGLFGIRKSFRLHKLL